MTRLPAVLLTAAALSLPATPAFAIGAAPCPPGELGVIVVDENGEVAEVCVRRDEIDAALDAARDAAGELLDGFRNCPPRTILPTIWTEGDLIFMEGGPGEYVACVLS